MKYELKMLKSLLASISVVACVCSAVLAADSPTASPTRETREMSLAREAIVMQLFLDRNAQTARRCTSDPYACVTPSSGELGIALLGSHSDQQGVSELVSLLQYSVDGAVSEDLTCYITRSGKTAGPLLKMVNPHTMHARCIAEVDARKKRFAPSFDKLESSSICASESDIKSRVTDLREAISQGDICSDEDF